MPGYSLFCGLYTLTTLRLVFNQIKLVVWTACMCQHSGNESSYKDVRHMSYSPCKYYCHTLPTIGPQLFLALLWAICTTMYIAPKLKVIYCSHTSAWTATSLSPPPTLLPGYSKLLSAHIRCSVLPETVVSTNRICI